MTMKLHNFFRSSTSTRLRIALNFKGLGYDYIPYVLRDGETRTPEYLSINAQGLVPTLELEDGTFLTQSLAIMEWLDERHPDPPFFPDDPQDRARVRALAYMVACEIHPLNNLRVLFRLRDQFGADEAAQKEWFVHWVTLTFDALETDLARSEKTGSYCFGNSPTFADICLYAQVWNNKRFDIKTSPWPTIHGIFRKLDDIEAFRKAAPPHQPDAA